MVSLHYSCNSSSTGVLHLHHRESISLLRCPSFSIRVLDISVLLRFENSQIDHVTVQPNQSNQYVENADCQNYKHVLCKRRFFFFKLQQSVILWIHIRTDPANEKMLDPKRRDNNPSRNKVTSNVPVVFFKVIEYLIFIPCPIFSKTQVAFFDCRP